MEGSRVVLVMREEAYGQALARALGDFYPQLSLRTAREFPLPEDQSELLVTDMPWGDSGFSPEKIAVLSDDPVAPQDEAARPCLLYRHMGVRRLGAELLFLCQGRSGLPFSSLASQTKAAGFIGGRGKTSVAFCAAEELASYHRKKVLYLSFEELPSPELFTSPDPAVRPLGDYLYYLFSGRHPELTGALEPFLLRDPFGVETFAYSGGRNELKELSREELASFMQDLWERRRYDYILLDFGEDLSSGTLYLAGLCERIFCLRDGSPGEIYKAEKLKKCLLQAHGEIFAERLVWVRNFWEPEVAVEDGEIPIEADPGSFIPQDGYWYINPSGGLGTGVRKIVDRLEGRRGGSLAERTYEEGTDYDQCRGDFFDG